MINLFLIVEGDERDQTLAVLQDLLTRLPETSVQIRPLPGEFRRTSVGEEQKMFALPVAQEVLHKEARAQEACPSQQLIEPLSARELEVLQLMAQGAQNGEIANDLVIAIGTVKRHVSNILSKLQADNRTHAVACARSYGLLC